MNWAQMMVLYPTRQSYFASSHEGVPDDGTRSCSLDVSPNLYCYGGGLYDYDKSGLVDHFFNVVHAADTTFVGWLYPVLICAAVVELLDIKVDDHIFKRVYNIISQWAHRIFPSDHTLLGDYYYTKKLVNDLGLPVEKIHSCKNGCMLYWKDNIDLEYCKFCGDARYKLLEGETHTERSPPYTILRYLSITPRL
ncbi:hypothetical protein Sango_0342300 [Sesamum angolense]|uniref:Uncharacterized protein n=1 Tax=Sesamum angolense TaxID=2727404 RepID=A0AAE2C3H5_9LAMI|nr:hypothetical protein Sango_0342300 [Sesamum angolense]